MSLMQYHLPESADNSSCFCCCSFQSCIRAQKDQNSVSFRNAIQNPAVNSETNKHQIFHSITASWESSEQQQQKTGVLTDDSNQTEGCVCVCASLLLWKPGVWGRLSVMETLAHPPQVTEARRLSNGREERKLLFSTQKCLEASNLLDTSQIKKSN